MSRTAPWVKVPLSQGVSQTFDFSVTMTRLTTMNAVSTVGSTNELPLPDFPHEASQVLRTNKQTFHDFHTIFFGSAHIAALLSLSKGVGVI